MIFAHAFWSKPLMSKKFFSYESALAINLVFAAYSVACCHKHGYKIKLYADKQGIEIFKNIPYDDVVELDIPEDNSYHFAASVKFYALQKMSLNEVLIDTDLFIEEKTGYDKLKSLKTDMVYSYDETTDMLMRYQKRYGDLLKFMSTNEPKYNLPTEDTVAWPNTSLMKFNNKELKQKYINDYFYHQELYKNIDFKNEWPDIIIEQYFLYELTKHDGYKIEGLVDYDNQQEIEKLGYNHIGNEKLRSYMQVRVQLWWNDIDTLKKIINQYKELTGKQLP